MEHVGRRKYVKHSVEHENKRSMQMMQHGEWTKSQRLRPSIPFATGDKSDDNDAQFSDALPTERRGHLLDYKRMTMQFDAAMEALKKTKPAVAKAIEEQVLCQKHSK